MGLIPKIIHQIQLDYDAPQTESMQSWKDLHPDYEYRLWDERTLATYFPDGLICQKAFENADRKTQETILRYEILFAFGGVYVDKKWKCLKKLDDLLGNDSFAAYKDEWESGRLVGEACLGVTQGNTLMQLLLDQIAESDTKASDPFLLTQTAFEYEYCPLTLYPSWYFYPSDPNAAYSPYACDEKAAFRPQPEKKIPKIIHQIWIGPKPPPQAIMESWKRHYPDYEYILWNEDKIAEEFPNGIRGQKQFDVQSKYAGKANILRYGILHKYGGVYIDADSVSYRQIDESLLENDSFGSFENEWRKGRVIANTVIGASQGCQLMDLLLNYIETLDCDRDSLLLNEQSWIVTGPLLLTNTVYEAKYRSFTIYPSWFFYPSHHGGFAYSGCGNPYADHYWYTTLPEKS